MIFTFFRIRDSLGGMTTRLRFERPRDRCSNVNRVKNYFLRNVQNGSGLKQPPVRGTGTHSARIKRLEHETDHSPNLMWVLRTCVPPYVFTSWFLIKHRDIFTSVTFGLYVLRALEDTVLRGILGSKKVEVTEVWRRLHNERVDIYVLHLMLLGLLCRRR
jgi:hypothetical protein